MASQVDHAEIKMGQLLTMAIATTALALQDFRPLLALGIIFFLSGMIRTISPFNLLYRYLISPLGIMSSDYRLDNIQAHKFGQLIGVLTIAIALGLILAGYPIAGWATVTILIILTAVSYAGWCIGCFMYYQLNRIGLGGFFKHAPTDKSVVAGQRPEK